MTSSDVCDGAVLASSCIKGCLRAGAMYNISRHVFLPSHKLNMEVDLQSLFGLHTSRDVHSCTHWLRPAFGLVYEGAIGSKDR